MNGYFEAPKHSLRKIKTQQRFKPPYDEILVQSIRGFVDTGLLMLKDIGEGVNYEDMCKTIISGIPYNYYMPELTEYFEGWHNRFKQENNNEKRSIIFKELINDLNNKGLISKDIQGLTGDFSRKVQEIITPKQDKNPTH